MQEDYPRNLTEFERRFADEAACRAYLAGLRWPSGFVCPRCGCGPGWVTRRGLIMCRSCGYQASLTAGTIFQDTRKPLAVWFRALWALTSSKGGSSAMQVKRMLGLASYETAWVWLHKLRRAMVRPGRERLAGHVEVDEAFIGGVQAGLGGRHAGHKALIVVAAQHDGRRIGRIRMRRIPSASAVHLHPFVQDCIAPGSILHTDGWSGYRGLEAKGFARQISKIRRPRQAPELLPRVHLVVSLLKRWLLGTHQGAVRPRYLDYYLDEFTFRFNRRTSASRGKLFYRLAQQAAATAPAPRRTLAGDASPDHNL